MVASEWYVRDNLRRNIPERTTHLGTRIPADVDRSEIPDRLRSLTLDLWQHQWDTETTGRVTYSFIPSIRARLEVRLRHDKHLTAVLTGHGSFRSHNPLRYTYGDPDDPTGDVDEACPSYGILDDPRHRILECPRFDEERNALRGALARAHSPVAWPPRLDSLGLMTAIHKLLGRFDPEVAVASETNSGLARLRLGPQGGAS
ncbi:hypothetical protein M8J76_016679 [Diaphorina citri]|nr:hypothetical protein M8J75_011126 [Diaphorina citri]KAI5724186.1 hypothetical protein M8J76_016679 [Diaphorina citri]KAI5728943.1 hypothetical protein M8J77_023547 [Diaphorina citri]